MAAFERKEYSTQKIHKLIDQAESGDMEALKELQRQNSLMAKAANERMRRLERAGMVSRETDEIKGTAAYDRAKFFLQDQLGLNNFSEGKNRTLDQIREQIDQELAFLNSLTSTPIGERMRIRNAEAGIKELAGEVFRPADVSADQKYTASAKEVRSLENFFRSDAWAALRERGITSPTEVKEAAAALNKGASMLTLRALVKDYENGELTKFQVWQGWTSGMTAAEVREKAHR